MNLRIKNKLKPRNKTYVILANSSKYIFHYRLFLLLEMKKTNNNLIAIGPVDDYSYKLGKYIFFIEWAKKESLTLNFINIFFNFIKLLIIIIKVKPNLIHSHTLYSNLLSSVICSLLGIKNVLSFAGLGRLKMGNIASKYLLKIILKIIIYFASNSWLRFSAFNRNINRTALIFQNDDDKEFAKQFFGKNLKVRTICGSGLPQKYYAKDIFSNFSSKKINFIYCSRLLKSKGIEIFLEIAKEFKEYSFSIYGEPDFLSSDSINKKDILFWESQLKNVKFFGNCEDPLLNLDKSFINIMIFPSIYGEGLPRSILEAGSQYVPVISNEIINKSHGYSKFIYMTKNHSLKGYLEQLDIVLREIGNGKIAEKMLKMREFVISNYSEESVVKKTLELYNELGY